MIRQFPPKRRIAQERQMPQKGIIYEATEHNGSHSISSKGATGYPELSCQYLLERIHTRLRLHVFKEALR